MNILFLTWKDITHPSKWWAETVIYNYAKRLIARGHTVIWFASTFPGAERESVIDGIHIIRKFHMHTAWLFGWIWYRKWKKQNHIDIIIDEAGGWPLLSPLYEKKIPILFLIHHIGDDEFQKYWYIGKFAKKLYHSMIRQYRSYTTITVSNSTRDELVNDFWFSRNDISVIENVCDRMPIQNVDFTQKEKKILFLGRIMPVKRVEDAIRAFSVFFHSDSHFSEYILNIAGTYQDLGYFHTLKLIIQELHLEDRVFFSGYIDNEKMQDFITPHKILLVPSKKEGFWLVILEANAYGISAIGYDVPGLRDSIHPWVNGFLIPDGDYQSMGMKLAEVIRDTDFYEKLSIQSLEYVKRLGNWDTKTDELEKILSELWIHE